MLRGCLWGICPGDAVLQVGLEEVGHVVEVLQVPVGRLSSLCRKAGGV